MSATAVKTTRYFVGNFPYGTTQEELAQVFDTFGAVTKADIILDKETGKSVGDLVTSHWKAWAVAWSRI